MSSRVRFNKDIIKTCKYVTQDKFYEVVCEYQSTVVIQDDSGTVCGYPKAWIEERQDYV